MDQLVSFLHATSRIMWGPWTLGIILGSGLILSFVTGWKHIKAKPLWENTFGAYFKKEGQKSKGDLSSFQAIVASMASCLGVGTIVGVATAIATGGPGAIFWMWLAGFLSMSTKFAEMVMAVHYRKKNEKGQWIGGPMYYAEHGLKRIGKPLAVIFSLSVPIAAVGIGGMVQANAVAGVMHTTFSLPRLATGLILVVVVGAVILGGVKKIGLVAERLIPPMAGLVILASLIGIFMNISAVPAAFGAIFGGAFTFQAGLGGFAGAGIATAMRFGIARGLFSNEAGLGSGPIVNATAKVDHPVKQGFWGTVLVFVDTHLVCTLVALIIIISGAWTQLDSAGNPFIGVPLVLEAYNSLLPGGFFGSVVISLGIILFGTTTMIGWSYYGEKGLEYFFGTKSNVPYRIFWLIPLVFGALGNITTVWAFSDVFNSFMLLPNLITLLALSGVTAKLTKDFFAKKPYVSYYEENIQLEKGINQEQKQANNAENQPLNNEAEETV